MRLQGFKPLAFVVGTSIDIERSHPCSQSRSNRRGESRVARRR